MTTKLAEQLTIGIKHTSRFSRRRIMLTALLQSIRNLHGHSVRILVADDGGMTQRSNLLGAELIELPDSSGLSRGRNALVHAAHTPYVAVLDDDVLFHDSTRLDVLLQALNESPRAVLAAGCYIDVRFPDNEDCFNLQFHTEEGGAVVQARPIHEQRPGCQLVHAAHNFFVARTHVLQRFGWDPRQKIMEHETFFYQLHLNDLPVLACSGVSVRHNTTRDEQYRERSFRLQEARFMQYLCKNLPEIKRFQTPYLLWRCDTRTFCSPAWHAQFPYDGMECKPMRWGPSDDGSTIKRPLLSPVIHSPSRFENKAGQASISHSWVELPRVPLLALIMSERRNVRRREWQRATWTSFAWHRGYLDHKLVPWRYVYVMGRDADARAAGNGEESLDQLVGDTVTLRNVTETYANLVFKTMEALRWALRSASFEVLLKVDDDSIVHVGRLWVWIFHQLPLEDPSAPPPHLLYAGRVFRNSQVIRSNFTRADLWHPSWYPDYFRKWAVDPDVFAEAEYPAYCGGGGYLVGATAARRIVREYDARYAGRREIIPVEDAFLGVLARTQGITPREVPTFQEPPRGSLQTRETFIDQLLVHRVVEPYKAFRWLMLSSNCHAGAVQCGAAQNRTRGLVSQGPLSTSPDSLEVMREDSTLPRYDKDWVSGSIPRGSADALTGSNTPVDGGLASATHPHTRLQKRRRKTKKRRREGRRREHQSF